MIIVYGIGIFVSVWLLLKKKQYRNAAVVMFLGCVVSLFLELTGNLLSDQESLSGLQREDKGGKKQYIEVTAEVEDTSEEFTFQIAPQNYPVDELKYLWNEAETKIEGMIFPEGVTPDHVDRDLSLPDRIEGMPFTLQWESSDPMLLSAEGLLGDSVDLSGELVKLTVTGRVEDSDFEGSRELQLKVFPECTEKAFFERLGEYVSGMEKESRDSPTYDLPEVFEGETVIWKKKRSHDADAVFLLTCIASVLTVMGQKQKEGKAKKRELELLEKEYPQLASRMVMLMGAGMTVSGAFCKIAGDYKGRKSKKKKLIYEEVIFTCHELDSGISEVRAYQNMGIRCRLPCYARFTSLLIQCVKRGSGGCREALREEASQALRDRKALAKRLGEEAGTKLLFPMILMLILVMAIIMIPAFTTFTM